MRRVISTVICTIFALVVNPGTAEPTPPVGKLVRVEGVVVVNQGAQYVKAQEGMPLADGDRLMTMEGGTAILQFADGCRYTMGSAELLTVGSLSTCAAVSGGTYPIDPQAGVAAITGVPTRIQRAAMEPPSAKRCQGPNLDTAALESCCRDIKLMRRRSRPVVAMPTATRRRSRPVPQRPRRSPRRSRAAVLPATFRDARWRGLGREAPLERQQLAKARPLPPERPLAYYPRF